MALPITVPYTFGNATTAIPLSNLDSDYATVYQAVNGIGNGSVALANVAITGGTISGNTTASNVTVSSGTFTNVTLSNVTISSVSTPITAAEGGTGSSSAFTTNGVVYASSTSALATGSALTFDGTNLGVGTSSPTVKLQVNQTTGNNGIRILSSNATTQNMLQMYHTDSIAVIETSYLGSGGFKDIVLNSQGGNLGLGVTPSAWSTVTALQIKNASVYGYSTSEAGVNQNAYYGSGNSRYISAVAATAYRQISGAHSWHISSGTPVADGAISFTQAMTLDASNNLLVGQTSAGLVNLNSFSVNIGSGTGAAGSFTANHVSGSASGNYYAIFGYSGGTIGSITQSSTTAVLFNVTSDQRLKENIVDAAPASSLIDAIQVRQYNWKSDGSFQRYGFIAQELVIVAPEAVHQPADPDDMMAVDYSKLVPMLVKEIQSLRKRILTLENK